MLVTQWHIVEWENFMFEHAFVMGRQYIISALVDLFDTLPAIDHVDEAGRHPMTPLLIEVGLQILIKENRITGDDDLTGSGLDADTLMARGVTRCREDANAGDNLGLAFDGFKLATGKGRFNTELG